EVAGPLRLGSVNATMREIVPPAVQRLLADHPRLEISAQDGVASTFLPLLRSGDLDVVIAESWENRRLSVPPGITLERLLEEEVDLAVPAGHALADRGSSDLSDLSDEPWIACPASAEAHHGMIQALRERGTEPRIAFTVTDFATQLEIVRAGLALALVPRIAQPWSSGGVDFLPCRPAVNRSFVVLVREGPARPTVQACLQALRAVAGTRGRGPVDLSR
nr:LysR family transcriptional regulator [Actinomycetota bacterium]